MGSIVAIISIALALADVRMVRRVRTEPDPSFMLASADGTQAYVAHRAFVGTYDLITGTRVAEYPGCPDVEALATTDKYLVFGGTRCLGIVTFPEGRFTTRELPGAVRAIVFSRDKKTVYISCRMAGFYKLDLTEGQLQPVETGYITESLVLSPDGSRLYVSFRDGGPGGKRGHDVIGIYDTATDRRVGVIAGLPNVGDRMAVSPDGKTLWSLGLDACSSRAYDHTGCPVVPGGLLNIIDTGTRRLVHAIGLPGPLHPHAVWFVPHRPWAVLSGAGLTFIHTTTYQVLGHDPTLQTRDLFFDPSGRVAYAALPHRSGVGVLQLPPLPAIISQNRSSSVSRSRGQAPKAAPPTVPVRR